MRYDTVLFDLDGTLTDSGPGIFHGVEYALMHFGISEYTDEILRSFVGPPLRESFSKNFGFDSEKADEAVRVYREYYIKKGVYENEVYDGIRETLARLKENGVTLAVATSKPEETSLMVLEHFDLKKYFTVITGATVDGSFVLKADVIRKALSVLKEKGAGINPVMVGDREHDVIGAKENNIPCIGVLYGYGDRNELEGAGADMIAETPSDIYGYIL